MKNPKNAIGMLFVLIVFSFSAVAQQKSITVSGKVVDSLSGAAIPNATILLCALKASITQPPDPNNLGDLTYDTVYSKTDGTFSASLSVPQSANVLVYGILKQDYAIKYSYTLILLSSVNLGTIKLSKSDVLIKDTIAITGTVVDSTTGKGIPGAQVIMTGLGSFDTAGNTVLTDADGKIAKQVIVGNSAAAKELVYMVSKDGYFSALGQQQISGKTLDLGAITLKSINQGVIMSNAAIRRQFGAPSMALYSLGGRLLYSGNLPSIDKRRLFTSGMAIAVYGNRNGLALKRKIMTLP